MARLKDKAARLFGRGRYDKAVLAYREVVASDPRDMNSRLRLGDAYRRLNKMGSALLCYREVADFYARDGLLLKAIAACKLVLDLDPSHEDTQSLLADLYSKRYGGCAPGSAGVKDTSVPPAQNGAPPSDGGEDSLPSDVGQTDGGGVRPSRGAVDLDLSGDGLEGAGDMEGLIERTGYETDVDLEPAADPEPELESEMEFETEPDLDPELESEMELERDDEGDDPFLVHLGPDDEEVEVDLDVLDDEEIDIGSLEPPPPPSPPPQRELPVIPLFSDLDRSAFIEILERMTLRELSKGETVVREGERGDAFYVVVSGTLRVSREVEGAHVDLAVLKEGHFFGEMAILSSRPRQATVTASSEASIFVIERSLLEELRAKHACVKEALETFYRQRLLGNVLATSPIFRPFEKSERRKLIDHFIALEAEPRDLIITEGESTDGLFVVVSGELVALHGSGFQEVTLGRLSEGDVFGEMSLMSREPATATVKALTRCVLLRLPPQSFSELSMTHPQILDAMSRLSDIRQARTSEILERMSASMGELDLDDDSLIML